MTPIWIINLDERTATTEGVTKVSFTLNEGGELHPHVVTPINDHIPSPRTIALAQEAIYAFVEEAQRQGRWPMRSK